MSEVRPALADIRTYWIRPIGATVLLGVSIGAALFVSPFGAGPIKTMAAVSQKPVTSMQAEEIKPNSPFETLIVNIQQAPPYQAGRALPRIGMYNTTPQPIEQPYIQHEFVDWRESHYLAYVLAASQQQGNTSLVTIEPLGEEDGAQLLADITAGNHDQTLQELAAVVATSKHPVYIRFAHEMDLARLYPWGNQNPQLFIQAYQHVIDTFRAEGAHQARWIWSPAGNHGAGVYYPGDSYVDVIGTTILYDAYWYGSTKLTFRQLAQQRQWLQSYNKPVWVVEFGVGAADRVYQQALINDALTTYAAAGYDALLYLNMRDANIVGPDYHLQTADQFMQQPPEQLGSKNTGYAQENRITPFTPFTHDPLCHKSIYQLGIISNKHLCATR